MLCENLSSGFRTVLTKKHCIATEGGQMLEISDLEVLYCLCSENKSADQPCGFVFALAKSRFSHSSSDS